MEANNNNNVVDQCLVLGRAINAKRPREVRSILNSLSGAEMLHAVLTHRNIRGMNILMYALETGGYYARLGSIIRQFSAHPEAFRQQSIDSLLLYFDENKRENIRPLLAIFLAEYVTGGLSSHVELNSVTAEAFNRIYDRCFVSELVTPEDHEIVQAILDKLVINIDLFNAVMSQCDNAGQNSLVYAMVNDAWANEACSMLSKLCLSDADVFNRVISQCCARNKNPLMYAIDDINYDLVEQIMNKVSANPALLRSLVLQPRRGTGENCLMRALIIEGNCLMCALNGEDEYNEYNKATRITGLLFNQIRRDTWMFLDVITQQSSMQTNCLTHAIEAKNCDAVGTILDALLSSGNREKLRNVVTLQDDACTFNCLAWAIDSKNDDMIRLLINKLSQDPEILYDVVMQEGKGYNCLACAISIGNVNAVRMIINVMQNQSHLINELMEVGVQSAMDDLSNREDLSENDKATIEELINPLLITTSLSNN